MLQRAPESESRFSGVRETQVGEALWLFVHIPKTAGSSFRTALAERLKPEHNINIDKVRGTKSRDAAFGEAIDAFLALDRERRFAFASGHLKMAEALRIREAVDRPVKLLTMLRNPVSRVISEYRYQRTPAHPQHAQFIATFPTLESFVESRRSQNKMFRHLALPDETVDHAIARLESDFSLVGLVEMYPLSMQLCSRLTDQSFKAMGRVNVTKDTPNAEVQPSAELVESIRRANGKDQQLWRHFRDRLRRELPRAE